MVSLDDLDLLQDYLDGRLSSDEAITLELRLKSEPALSDALMILAREEVVFTEWAKVHSATEQLTTSARSTKHPKVPLRAKMHWAARIAAVLFMALGLAFLWMSQQPPVAMPIARLEHVAGRVLVTRSGAEKIASSEQELYPGSGLNVVGEESSAVIVYADGTRLDVDGETTISAISGGGTTSKRVALAKGSLRADVAKQPAGLPMILTTPKAEIVVLGTKFGLSGGVDATYVETREGAVRLTRKSDGQSVEVLAGFEGLAGESASLAAQRSPPRVQQPRFTTAGHHLTTALSPNGQTLVTSRFGRGEITLWNAADGRERMTIAAHTHPVIATVFTLDSRKLATADNDRSLKVWDVATGQLLTELTGPLLVQSLAFADDGETLLALAGHSQQPKTITSWNLKTNEPRTDSRSYPGIAWTFASDGRLLATSSVAKSTVTVWDTATGRELATLQNIPARVLCLAFSPHNSLLAVADMSGRLVLWNIAENRIQRTLYPAGQTVHGLAFSFDGALLATGQRFATVRLWDVATGTQQAILEGPVRPGSTATVRPMFFSPNAKTLATTESLDDGIVRLWDLPVKQN